MLKTNINPASFDGRKFAARYGLDPMKDFFIGHDGMLNYPDAVGPTPVFDPPDPMPVEPAGVRDKIRRGVATPAELQDFLAHMIKTGRL